MLTLTTPSCSAQSSAKANLVRSRIDRQNRAPSQPKASDRPGFLLTLLRALGSIHA